ncbi:MAG: PLP-dependent transferase [Varibaculum sp.]|nr:PLP-dependent transferase [Varibaculum sp.]
MSYRFDTLAIHAGQTPDSDTGARALPIYQTTAYVFPDADTAAKRFALQDFGPIYTRLTNPTNGVLEERISQLEGGVGGLVTASGAGAITLAILTIAETGDNIVAPHSLYGGTHALLGNNLPRYGIDVHWVTDPLDPASWEAAADEHTVAFFAETIPNPNADILDIEAVAGAAHRVGVPLIVDNTVATPYLTRPFEWGADIVVHSATKFLCGHGTAMLGAIVDSGRFDWSADPQRFRQFNVPDPSYHGLVYKDLGEPAFILKCRVQGQRDMGWAASPFNSFLVAQGIDTLSLRLDRHVSNAQKVAEFLAEHEQVETVNYPGLPDSPYYELGKKYAPKGPGSLVTFNIKGARAEGEKFVDALELHSNLANIGDVRSLVVHPASTTHSQNSPEELAAAGIGENTIRLSVGIEDIQDILEDLEKGFAALS